MTTQTNSEFQSKSKTDCLSPIALFIFLVWIGFVLMLRFGWEIIQSGLAPDQAVSGMLFLPVFESLAILLPGLILSITWKNQLYRSVFRTWSWAAFLIILLLPSRLTGATSLYEQALFHVIGLSVFIILVLYFDRRSHHGPLVFTRPWLDWRSAAALLTCGMLAIPWLSVGAFGSLLDTILQLLAGLLFGVAAAILIEMNLIRQNIRPADHQVMNIFGGGLTVAVTITIMISALGFAFGVMQVLLMLTIIPLSWGWISLRMWSLDKQSTLFTMANLSFAALLIGLSVAVPITLIDPNELPLIINSTAGEILSWAIRAAAISSLIGWVFSLICVISIQIHRTRQVKVDNLPAASTRAHLFLWITAGIIWAVAAIFYATQTRSGLFGDRMLVILKDQVVFTKPASQDHIQQRQFVYDRLVDQANNSQSDLRNVLDQLSIPYTPYYLVNSIELPNNPLLRWWISRRSEVDRILDSPRLRPLPAAVPVSAGPVDVITEPGWNLGAISAGQAQEVFNVSGEGVIIGQSDSGVQWDHPALLDSYRGKAGDHDYNWLDPWNSSPAPLDFGGHGTHTLGTIVGDGTGVAPGATWIACANLSRNLGNPALYLDCMQFMLAPYPQEADPFTDGRPDLGAMVLNNSWGCPVLEGCDPGTFSIAVQALRRAGVFVVASAGNDGPACSSLKDPLAIYPDVFSVGAIDSSMNLAQFSSIGPVTVDGSLRVKPDLLAPGVDILSTFPESTYNRLDGTSMAGPHVAGVVALMWSANPLLIGDIPTTEQILRETAKPYTGWKPDCPDASAIPSSASGFGIIDAYAAVNQAILLRSK